MNSIRSVAVAAAFIVTVGAVIEGKAEQRDSKQVLSYANAWIMSFHPDSGAAQPGQVWEDRMDTITWHGRRLMQRTQVEHLLNPVGATLRYTNIFDAHTMEPFMSETRRGDGVFDRYEYAAKTVMHTQSVPGGPATRRQPAGTVFDSTTNSYTVRSSFIDFFNGMYATVMALRPLSVGMNGTFDALIAPDTIVSVPFHVRAQETVKGVHGKPTLAYRVDLGDPNGPGGGMYTAWVIPSAPYVLRLTTRQALPAGLWSWDEVD